MSDYECNNSDFYTTISESYDPEILSDFEVYLYLTPLHVQTQADQKSKFFFLYSQKEKGTPLALFQCSNDEGSWFSPSQAPFGSIQFLPGCMPDEINFFLHCITRYICEQGGTRLTIRHYPNCYLKTTRDLVNDSYLFYGFTIAEKLINHYIPVSSKTFADVISKMEKRRLTKCINQNFSSGLDIETTAKKVYAFLSFCRSKKGYGMSLDEAQLTELMVTLPKEILIFSVKQNGLVIALSVTVRVNKRVLYNFLTDSLPEYNVFSPSVLLLQCIYNYCQKEKIEVLDLGTSLDHHGSEKVGLVRFKDNMGGIRSWKVTYSKDFFPI